MTQPIEIVTITKEEYDKLLQDAQFLEALEAAGVDNWCGYSEAYSILDEWMTEKVKNKGISGVGVKSVEIRRNTDCEGDLLEHY